MRRYRRCFAECDWQAVLFGLASQYWRSEHLLSPVHLRLLKLLLQGFQFRVGLPVPRECTACHYHKQRSLMRRWKVEGTAPMERAWWRWMRCDSGCLVCIYIYIWALCPFRFLPLPTSRCSWQHVSILLSSSKGNAS